MSKQIPYDRPLTPEEREWAVQFEGLHGQTLVAHAEMFPPEEPEQSLEPDGADEVPPYVEWSVRELQAEAKRRNAQEGTNLPTTGTKAELAKALEDDDQARGEG